MRMVRVRACVWTGVHDCTDCPRSARPPAIRHTYNFGGQGVELHAALDGGALDVASGDNLHDLGAEGVCGVRHSRFGGGLVGVGEPFGAVTAALASACQVVVDVISGGLGRSGDLGRLGRLGGAAARAAALPRAGGGGARGGGGGGGARGLRGVLRLWGRHGKRGEKSTQKDRGGRQ